MDLTVRRGVEVPDAQKLILEQVEYGSSGSVLGIVLGQGRGPVLVGAVGARLRVCGAVEDTD